MAASPGKRLAQLTLRVSKVNMMILEGAQPTGNVSAVFWVLWYNCEMESNQTTSYFFSLSSTMGQAVTENFAVGNFAAENFVVGNFALRKFRRKGILP